MFSRCPKSNAIDWKYFGLDAGSIIPAYNRQYDNLESALQDWKSGKDFKIKFAGGKDGPYCSIRDLAALQTKFDRLYLILPNINQAKQVF